MIKKNSSCTTDVAKKANNQLKDYINNTPKTAKEQSELLMGFCLHIAQDYYSHQVWVYLSKYVGKNLKPVYKKGTNNYRYTMTTINSVVGSNTLKCEDNVNVLPWRYKFTKETTDMILKLYKNKTKISGFSVSANGHSTNGYCGVYSFNNGKFYFSSYYQRIVCVY